MFVVGILFGCTTLCGCTGAILPPGAEGEAGSGRSPGSGTEGDVVPGKEVPTGDPAWDQAASPALRRLSRREFAHALVDIFQLTDLADAYLPSDVIEPFDTDSASKEPSAVFIEGLDSLAAVVAEEASANPAWVRGVGGCDADGSADSDCLNRFARQLGRRLWRRPLTDQELARLTAPALDYATEHDDFYVGARYIIQASFQHPEFVYRTEIGELDGELRRLTNFELISRLSFLVWGRSPDPPLLDLAVGPPLTSVELADIAKGMLDDPRAATNILTFHEQWLAYRDGVVPGALRDSFLQETNALLERVLVIEPRAWSELFTSQTTYVDSTLASHYGMNAVSDPTWVSYEHPQRAGLLSHGSILSLAARDTDDTSPVSRGHYVATRLLCRSVPPPPPDADVDNPPVPDADTCKFEAYAAHRDQGSTCYGCHVYMDPIGFGLERFGGLGQYREVEKQSAACEISGDGELFGTGTFNGPRELTEIMIQSGDLHTCVTEQFMHFSTGRAQISEDVPLIERVADRFVDSGEDFRALVLAFVSDPAFVYRREEAP